MSNLNEIIVGLRDSKLSRAQTKILLDQLQTIDEVKNSTSFVIKLIKTKGDIHKDQRLDQIGGKGLFIREIEEHIISNQVDVGIHSMKDIPAVETNNNLEVISWMKRENHREALLSNSGCTLSKLPSGSLIGTSSIRRRAQILSFRKDLKIKLLRGNVDTRIKHLKEKRYDAIILSLAGLKRLGLTDYVTEELDENFFLPPACQGTVGVQAKQGSHLKKLFAFVNHKKTEIVSLTERHVLKKISANCNSPVSVLAKIKDNDIFVKCEIFDHFGEKIFSKKVSDKKYNHIELADLIAENILKDLGQDKINELDKINDFNYSP